MNKIKDYANQLLTINSDLTVSNAEETDKLALVFDSNNNECACLLSFSNVHHCIIVPTIKENIKSNLKVAAHNSGFEVFISAQ